VSPRIEIATDDPVQSLCWVGDALVDVAGGLTRFSLDGTVRRRRFAVAFPFDAAVIAPSGRYAVMYQRLGTKGAIVNLAWLGIESPVSRTPFVFREIDRSYYFADRFEYPVAFVRDAAGNELLAHCPKEYNRLEIEEVESGRCLTMREGKSDDFFHSRLQMSPDGRHLLSAGWVWHPLGWIGLYDVERALRDPRSLDVQDDVTLFHGEILSAAFGDDPRLVLAGGCEINRAERDDKGIRWGVAPDHVAVFDLQRGERLGHVRFPRPVGEMMVFDDRVIGFYEHPRMYQLQTGELIAEWPDLPTGRQNGCIISDEDGPVVPIARDPVRRRFAVAAQGRIVVISVDPPR